MAAVRDATATAHADYMRAHARSIVFGGPLLAADGLTRVGTMLLVDMDDRAAAEAFIAHEPYNRAKLFERCVLHAYQLVIERGRAANIT